jgi:hypothetical protein
MDKKVEYVPLFPKEFEHLNENYERFKGELNAVDYELENAPNDAGPVPKNRPTGPEGYDTSMRERRERYLEANREKRIKGYRSSIEKQIIKLDAKEQETILSRYDFETSKNGFKDYKKEDLKAAKSVYKEDKASFDYMAASHFNKYQQPEIAKAGEKENIERWSDHYMEMLDSYKCKSMELDSRKDVEAPEIEQE